MNKRYDVNLVVLQFDLSVVVVFHIKPMFDSLLYAEFIVALMLPLLIAMHLFNDVLMSNPMTANLMSLVAVVMIVDLM
jgi:hypothetical protein